MSDPIVIPAWQRPHWTPSDAKILLQFYVFGKFEEGRVPSAEYGSTGLPAGITSTNHHHNALRAWDGYPLKGSMGKLFKEESPDAYRLAVDAPQVLVVRGEIDDSADTGYLRDTLGVLAGLLDVGGVAIADPQIVSLFSAEAWRRRYLVREGAPVRNHLLILRDDESESGKFWIHTRGMRKFGRPDVAIRHVPEKAIDKAGALAEKLTELQALGAHFADSQALEVDGMPQGLVAHRGGGPDDPDFNNAFVSFDWPA